MGYANAKALKGGVAAWKEAGFPMWRGRGLEKSPAMTNLHPGLAQGGRDIGAIRVKSQEHRVILLSGIISAVIGLAAGFIGGRLAPHPIPASAPPPASAALMQAQAFKLVDQAGHDRGVWGIDADGATRLALFGPKAALPLVNLAASPGGAPPCN